MHASTDSEGADIVERLRAKAPGELGENLLEQAALAIERLRGTYLSAVQGRADFRRSYSQPREKLTWRPIATAPRDGTEFLWHTINPLGGKHFAVIKYHEYIECFEEGVWLPLSDIDAETASVRDKEAADLILTLRARVEAAEMAAIGARDWFEAHRLDLAKIGPGTIPTWVTDAGRVAPDRARLSVTDRQETT